MSVYCILLLAIFTVGVEARLRRHFEPTPSGFNEDQAPRSRCWSSGNGQPAKWWNEGERVDRGKYWYECHRGQLVSRGCFSDNKERLEIGGKYAAGDYELECFMDQDGYLKFRHSACVDDNGQRHAAGDSWNDKDNLYWYECSKDGPYLRASIKGCLTHDKTKKLKLGERYDFGEYTYECNMKFNGSVSLCSVGCIHNGEHYNVGQQWPDGDFVFYCKLQGGRTRKVCVGCQFRDKRLYDGDRYHKENTVYQCQVRPDHYGHRPVGCVTKDDNGLTVERVLGCRWYRQEEDSKIEQTCQLDDAKKLAVVKTVSCIYRFKGYDTILLFPNTYTIWNAPGTKEAQGLACRTTANGDAQLETFDVSQVAQLTQGLKYEQPRG